MARVEAPQSLLAEAVAGLCGGVDWARFLIFQPQLYDYSTCC